MRKIAVLMATYNGEKYIRQQLDSILNQTWENTCIYIRDDHSSDSTPEILVEYMEKYPDRVFITLGRENLGYPQCFYALTDDEGIEADFYAFADQDDEWYPEKLAMAMEKIGKAKLDKAVAYYAGYDICDGDMNFVRKSDPVHKRYRLKDTMFEVCGLEFTMVVTRGAIELLRARKPVKANARGTWMSMLYSSLGYVYYDNRSVAKYRRHSSAVTNSQTGALGIWIWRIKNFFFGGFDEYRIILEDYLEVCGDCLTEKDRRLLERFQPGSYFPRVFSKVFYPHRLRNRWVDEIALRIIFIMGQL